MSDRTVAQKTRYLRPRAAVDESKDGRLHIIIEMPGVRKDGLDIRIENNELRIVGRREQPADKKYVFRERPQGDFYQSYTLDETVDQSKIDAALEKGILSITLDLKDHVKPRTIQVRGE